MIPLFVDLQGSASSAKDFSGFLYNISRAILSSAKRHRKIILPVLTREKLTEDPFSYFDEWLDEIEQKLDENQTFVLMLDDLCYEEEASQRVLTITRGHPALTQLLCSEIVNFKNKQDISIRHLVQISDVEAAIPGALQNGGFFLSDIRNNQVKTKTALAMLKYIAAQGEAAIVSELELKVKFPKDFEASKANLLQRELIETTGENAF